MRLPNLGLVDLLGRGSSTGDIPIFVRDDVGHLTPSQFIDLHIIISLRRHARRRGRRRRRNRLFRWTEKGRSVAPPPRIRWGCQPSEPGSSGGTADPFLGGRPEAFTGAKRLVADRAS